jgi:glyoxylase-like metal-dependent hydrolase (beta-lactamase superfamily II)
MPQRGLTAAYHSGMRTESSTAAVHLLHAGYARDDGHVGSSIALVVDGDSRIVTDPGMVASRGHILDPLAAHDVHPNDVSHVFITHHHPDHTVNIALFPNAEVVDFWARYKDDLWIDVPDDGFELGPNSTIWLTPGHTEQDATLVVRAADAAYALTHLWWFSDRTPEIDPVAPDQAVLERSRARVLEAVDIVIPGHGGPFRVRG